MRAIGLGINYGDSHPGGSTSCPYVILQIAFLIILKIEWQLLAIQFLKVWNQIDNCFF
jgi:hypothetical protein